MFLYIILFYSITNNVFSANILFISPIESMSHHIWSEVLVRSLLEKGHNITLVGHHDTKIKSDNYTLCRLTGFEDIYKDRMLQEQPFMDLINYWNFMMYSSEVHLKSDALNVILTYQKDKFDLIVFDLFAGQEFYPLIEYFGNPPVIGISPFGLPPYILDALGSHFYYYYPFYSLAYTDNMTFFQRFENSLLYLLDYLLKWYHMPIIYQMTQERYGENIISFDQVEKRIGLLLANYDPVLEFAQPLPPNIIPVGGMHVKRTERLSNDVQKILEKANNGIIYFSFGTIVQPSWLSTKTKEVLLGVFSKLNQTVLWKYAADDLEDIPKNVVIKKWYSQNDILEHKNMRLFITHSGSLGSQEAMYHGVPVLGIPFFADQKVIAGKMAAKGLGRQLRIADLTEDVLYKTILEVINNPIYKKNMQKISRIFRDQKEPPLERAIFWIEYALGNKDLSHLSIKARDMTLFQRENLDVYGIVLLLIIVVIVLFLIIIKLCVNHFIFKKKLKIKQN